MFDIGFGQLLLIMIIALVVLGPERLPVAIKTVASWIRVLRSLSTTVQMELSKELKLQELQESLHKAERAGLQNLTPELKSSMNELREAAEAMQRSYQETGNTLNSAVVKSTQSASATVELNATVEAGSSETAATDTPASVKNDTSHNNDK